jgi:electron transfer flavoprotein beta subunit
LVNIVVLTRAVPDTAAKIEVVGGQINTGGAAQVVNPWDEYALEEAIVQAGKDNGKATVIALGSEAHNDALKHALAMGMTEAVRVHDPALDPTDSLAYAVAAAAAVKKVGEVDLVLCGKESIDVGTDQHIYQTARKLGWTMLSYVSKILEIGSGTIKVERMVEGGKQVLVSKLPAVVSVMKEINEPRYPSFIGIRKASKAAIPEWSLADLGVTLPAKTTQTVAFRNLPARNVQVEMIEGDPAEQAKKLVDKLFEEKVL